MNARLFSGMTLALQGDGDGDDDRAGVRDVAIRWSPLPIERLMIGQRAGDAQTLVPAALALCWQAHCAAAQRALDAAQTATYTVAQTQPASADFSAREDRVRIEAARETLRRWLIDFPAAFGQPWPDGLLAQWPRLDTLAALAGFCAAHVFGPKLGPGPASAAQWLALDDGGQRDWAERGGSVPARWLRNLLRDADRPVLIAPARVIAHARQHAAALIAGAPVAGLPHSPPHAQLWDAALALPDLASGLLMARLRHLAQLCAGGQGAGAAARPASGGERSGDIGIGWAHTARGLLVHLARVEQGVVTAYRILAPTQWNFGPSTLLRQALAGRSRDDARRRLERLALLLDPCVPFTTGAGQHA